MASVADDFLYDVFLSFRGEDTRHGFIGNLCKALDDKGVRTFIDDVKLLKGDEITPSLLKAIDESMMAIVVLSENYASSSFCLQELSKILDAIKDKGRCVLPVFYKVDPSDIRKLKKSYGAAMAQHEKRSSSNMNLLQKWKNALNQVANLSGFDYKGDVYEHEFIGKIVEQVLKNSKPVALPVDDYLVGLEDQKQHVTSLLNVESNDTVHMVGIHGIGGIGKTTLALEVYNSIVLQFQSSCFLEKVRENSDKNGLIYLQKMLLSQIVGEKNMEVTSVGEGVSILQKRLRQKKVLLLLDDVDKLEQLEAIAGRSIWFGAGSRVIITTRDKRLLTRHEIERTYEVKGLNDEDAFDLVGRKALKNKYSPRDKDILLVQKYDRELMDVSELRKLKDLKNNKVFSSYAHVLKRVVEYASGLPLALEVIGSHFFNKTIDECKYALDRYERVPDKKIQMTLQLSYDTLQAEEKTVFLDIACCFKGYKLTRVEQILHAHHGDVMKDHINVLVEKSLIKISESGNVTMHDLVEDMGKEIVRQESPEDPGKRSRLWSSKDIIQVLQENTGRSKIEIIHFNGWIREKWDGESLKKMENLKTLIFSGLVDFSKNPIHLPNSLRVLECCNYQNHSNSPNEWNGFLSQFITKKPQNINKSSLYLDRSDGLAELPDISISGLQNSKEFSIQNCRDLITIDKSVGFLHKLIILRFIGLLEIKSVPLNSASLVELEFSHCDSLESFTGFLHKIKILRVISCNKIKIIPSLKSLEELNLSNCTSLETFSSREDGFGDKLKIMSVKGCINLRSIPPLKLDSLEELSLSDCDSLESFAFVVDGFIGKLKTLTVKSCHNLRSIPPLKLDSLEKLDLSNCDCLERFPSVVDKFLGKLKTLNVKSCRNLRSIPPLKLDLLEKLDLSYCDSLECFPLVVDGFLTKLKTLNVKSCRNLRSIPPLRLDSIERLDFSDCDSLESFPLVVDGFLGKLKTLNVKSCRNLRGIPPLRLDSLERLELSDCDNLESFPLVADDFLGKLKTLKVKSCRNLRSIPPLRLDSLERLDLSDCDSLKSFPLVVDGFLGKLKTLNVKSCRNLKSIPPLRLDSLERLDLSNCGSLESFPLVVDGFLGKLKTLNVKSCRSLRSIPPLRLDSLERLDLSDCDSLESFPLVVDGFLGQLKTLNVKSCRNLISIPPLRLDSLERFDLSGCCSLESFPLVVDGFLGKLKTLNVKSCRNLRSIPSLRLDSLERLDLSDCDSLESFPLVVDRFLGKLKTLIVKSCRNLRSIPPLKLDSLEKLDLSNCDSLESFPLVVDGFLGKLKTLNVKSCRNLRSIPPLKLDSLENLDLSNCYSLENFPIVVDGLLDKLKFLSIKRCVMLKSIPPLKLTSLEWFDLSYCPSLESFPEILGEM